MQKQKIFFQIELKESPPTHDMTIHHPHEFI